MSEGNFSAIDAGAVRDAIVDRGFTIVHDILPVDEVTAIREFWLRAFENRATLAPTIWGPHLGEENKILFHRSDFDCLYRAYDFLWNPPIDDLTRSVGLELNRVRNQVAEMAPYAGETFQPDGYGVYVTVSYYPPGDGWLREHEDRTDMRRHWHFIVPLTFKGTDFAGGGLYMIDRAGKRVDVDAEFRPGSVLFFDGSLTHGVERIESADDKPLGRMQMFSIPTFLELPHQNDRMAESIPISTFIKAKLRPIKHRLTRVRGDAPSERYFL